MYLINTLNTLNLYNVMCQLYLSKAGKGKKIVDRAAAQDKIQTGNKNTVWAKF